MNTLSRIGAACGAVFAIVLTIAAGDGSQSFSGPRAAAGVAALTVAVPFIAYLCGVLRGQAAEGDRWLAGAALAAGMTGIVLKLGSGAPELALHKAHLIPGTQLYSTINAIAGGATVLSLFPLAVFCAANGAFLGTGSVPALLLFLLWTLLASVHLLRQTWRKPAPVGRAQATAHA